MAQVPRAAHSGPGAGCYPVPAALHPETSAGLFSDERVSFLVASKPEEVSALLPALPLARPAFLRLRPAIESYPGWFRVAEEVVQSWLLRREINLNTLNRFGRLWVRNLVRNMRSFLHAPGISRLQASAPGFPPSSSRGDLRSTALFPYLSSLRERLVIISVNTPLARCAEAGCRSRISPSWSTRSTGLHGSWIGRSRARGRGTRKRRPASSSPSPPRTPACCETPCPPRRGRQRCTFAALCSLSARRWKRPSDKKANSGREGPWQLPRGTLRDTFGASPIYTAGLDLGYPGMRTHCKGVFTEELWLSVCSRLRPMETSSFRYLREIGLLPVPSATGGSTQTDRRMLLYKWWFENQLTMHPEAQTFSLSPDSVAIQGMPLARLSEVLSPPAGAAGNRCAD